MTSQSDTEALRALVALAKKATPGPWTKIGSAKRTLFTTAQGQQTVAPDKAFLPVEIVTCLRHAEQAQADCDFVQAARNAIPAIERMLASQMGEPVAWMYTREGYYPAVRWDRNDEGLLSSPEWTRTPLYAAPASGMDADNK